MWAVIVALTLFAAPPSRPVAVDWHGDDGDGAPDERTREAVREAIAGVDGRPVAAVEDQALDRARLAVSREHPAAIQALAVEVRSELDRADAAYREGRLDDAGAQITELLTRLQAHPELPGAATSAREAELLAARVAWARADPAAAERALIAALRLDPEARLAARRAPPELIARYDVLQAELLGDRDHAWVTASFESADGGVIELEIDGVPGPGPVPPGHHFVVVYRVGHEPVASYRDIADPWVVPSSPERITDSPDHDHEAVCEALALGLLVLVERRGAELGIQGYACGVGYGPVWSGTREALATGAAEAVAGPFAATSPSLAGAWTPTIVDAPVIADEPPIVERKPWVRRGWIWGTSAGVLAVVTGAVITGVVLGGRSRAPTLEIDADQFIGSP